MTQLASNNEYRGFPNHLRVALVYLVTALLTMGASPISMAKSSDKEESAVAEISPSQHSQVLFLLLTAEIAASRHEEAIALHNYLQAAEITQDPAIAEQATQMAINFQAPLEATMGAELWAKTAPNNLQAQLIAMTLSIGHSSEKALPYLSRAIEINPTQVDQYIMEIQTRLSDSSALKLKEALAEIALQKPKDAYAHLVAAQSAAQQGDIRNANRLVDIALQLIPDLTHALQLKARLIRYSAETDASALKFLAEKVQQFPHNKELMLFYANALIDNGNTAEAKIQLMPVVEDKQLGGQALVTLGDIFLKEDKIAQAKETLTKALEFSDSRDYAQFLLGQVEERQGNIPAAIRWYSDIQPGSYQILATMRAATLLKKIKAYKEAISLLHNATPTTIEEQKQLILAEIDLLNTSNANDEAMELVNEVLPKLPNDPDILYMHAITASKLKKWEIAEESLNKILKQNPNNANAQNAMGYVLSFNKNRWKESIEHLNQALALAPNNPYFMDTLGWVHFRQGDLQQAKTYLQKASSLSDDGEIAAHFGEVLWSNNQKEDAILVWKKALEKNNDHPALLETIRRLHVNLNP